MTEAEVKERRYDARMLILYVLIITVFASVFTFLINAQHRSDADRHRFEGAIVANCLTSQANTIKFNEFISKLQLTYTASDRLSAAEKEKWVAFFEGGKSAVPTCPPVRVHR